MSLADSSDMILEAVPCFLCPQEDWGELNTGKRTPALFVLDTTTWQVSRIGNLPADHSVGQPVWSPEGDIMASRLT